MWSGVPYQAFSALSLLMSPLKPSENGTPLAKVEIPEICQPFRTPPRTPPLTASGIA